MRSIGAPDSLHTTVGCLRGVCCRRVNNCGGDGGDWLGCRVRGCDRRLDCGDSRRVGGGSLLDGYFLRLHFGRCQFHPPCGPSDLAEEETDYEQSQTGQQETQVPKLLG